jgi:hypothetical protein
LVVGPDQIQPASAAVSADGCDLLRRAGACGETLEKQHENRETASATDPPPNYFAGTSARWHGVKNYFSLMASRKSV